MYKRQYNIQKRNAIRRGIEFLLSYEEWIEIWGDKIENRGRGIGKYCMARKGDIGPYSIDNVYITLFEDNNKDQYKNEKLDITKLYGKQVFGKDHYKTYPVEVTNKKEQIPRVFNTIEEAANFYHIDKTTIFRNMSGKVNGKYIVRKI